MKKIAPIRLLLPAAVALCFAACNNSSDTKAGSDSGSIVPLDTPYKAGADSSANNSMNNNMSTDTAMGEHAMATLSGTKPDTTVSGTVKFDKDGNKVKMTLDIDVPKKAGSSVAVHIHDMGMCGDMGEQAMGHWNPTNEAHGKWGSAHYHSGDFGNISLDKNGHGHLEVSSDRWTIGGDAKTNVLNHGIIVHSGKDDYTGASGNSGPRIGCGVIGRS